MGYRHRYLKSKKIGFHMCAYCGKPMTTKHMTVDHIIPQNLFRKLNKLVALINVLVLLTTYTNKEMFPLALKFSVISSVIALVLWRVKDMKFNLIASCSDCNSKKSDKLDLRILFAFGLKSIPLFAGIAIVYFMVNKIFPGAPKELFQSFVDFIRTV